MLNTLGEMKTNGWTNLTMQQQNLETYFKDFRQEKELPSYLLHLPEHPEEVEPGELAEVLQRPGPGIKQRHEELGVVADVRETHWDPGSES